MCGTPPRPTSPAGGSILVTSGPRSRKAFVQAGPDRTRVKSMTLIPCKGASISVPFEDCRAWAGRDKCRQAATLILALPHPFIDFGLASVGESRTTLRREVGDSLDGSQSHSGAGGQLLGPR